MHSAAPGKHDEFFVFRRADGTLDQAEWESGSNCGGLIGIYPPAWNHHFGLKSDFDSTVKSGNEIRPCLVRALIFHRQPKLSSAAAIRNLE
jgi:hypothetical protein